MLPPGGGVAGELVEALLLGAREGSAGGGVEHAELVGDVDALEVVAGVEVEDDAGFGVVCDVDELVDVDGEVAGMLMDAVDHAVGHLRSQGGAREQDARDHLLRREFLESIRGRAGEAFGIEDHECCRAREVVRAAEEGNRAAAIDAGGERVEMSRMPVFAEQLAVRVEDGDLAGIVQIVMACDDDVAAEDGELADYIGRLERLTFHGDGASGRESPEFLAGGIEAEEGDAFLSCGESGDEEDVGCAVAFQVADPDVALAVGVDRLVQAAKLATPQDGAIAVETDQGIVHDMSGGEGERAEIALEGESGAE